MALALFGFVVGSGGDEDGSEFMRDVRKVRADGRSEEGAGIFVAVV